MSMIPALFCSMITALTCGDKICEKFCVKADFHEAKSSANSLEKSTDMRTFVCFDFTSEMRRIFSSRKSRNDSYFFVTKKFARHFKPIRIKKNFRREFAG